MVRRRGRARHAPGGLWPTCAVGLGAVVLTGSLSQLLPALGQSQATGTSASTDAGPDLDVLELIGSAPDQLVDEPSPAAAAGPLPAAGQRSSTGADDVPASGGRRAPARPDAAVAEPESVSIPSVGVHTRLIRLALNPDKTLQVPRSFTHAGWYTGGAAPGAVGPAVIVGHYDSEDGPAVFYRLKDLRPGQRVQVRRADDSVVEFSIDHVKRFGKAELRLITCGGTFDRRTGHYRDNSAPHAVC